MATEPVRTTETEPTIGRLVADASRDISTLVSKEIELAKRELKVSATAGGVGAGLLIAAAYIMTIAFVIFSFAVAYFINWNGKGLSLHWAFLIVFGAWALLAALLGFIGVQRFKKVRAPERAIAQGKELPQAIRGKKA